MGLFFRSRRRRRGPGLFGILIILGLMVAAAPLILNNSASLFTSCQNMSQSLGAGGGMCVGLQRMLVSLNDVTGLASKKLGTMQTASSDGVGGLQTSWRERWQSMMQNLDSGTSWQGGAGASSMVSMDAVREMMQSGGQQGSWGNSPADKLKAGFSNFMAGQSVEQSREGDLESQLAWYRNGAGIGEYGILSQLKLGSMYMQGGEGLAPDMGQAYDYNMQALGSLQQLQSSPAPEAKAALNALPMEPAQLQQQLQESLRELQLRQ